MKGYKALNRDLTAKNGFQFEVGKEYTINGKLEMCKNGFHFCKNIIDVFGYYGFDKANTIVCEVEADGEIAQEGTKYCAEKIKLIRILGWNEIEGIIDNNHNSGRYNSGDCNSGHRNSGHYNSGHCNSGNYNSGHCNSGHYNSGDYNSGHYNSGHCNSGHRNSGHYNSGDRNSGHHNSGHYNSGHCNSGDRNSGFFNSNEPTVRLFNCDTNMTFAEFYTLGINFTNLEDSKDIIKSLPNYDAQIFYDCTGIDWRDEK